MKYRFNFEYRDKPVQFNREKLLLSALQDLEQLYYMMDTQYDGLYQAEALERRRQYGANCYVDLLRTSKFRLFPGLRDEILSAFDALQRQPAAVFRRGIHFYAEVETEGLVPGDVVFISKGDIVPADLRIIFSKGLVVNQDLYPHSESRVSKGSGYNIDRVLPNQLTEVPNLCFVGSTVIDGLARGIVMGTGAATYMAHLLGG